MLSGKGKGLVCGMIASITYGMNPLFALPLYKEGLDADSVLFYRYGLAIVFLGLLMKIKGVSFKITRKEILPLFLAGIVFSGSSLLLFLSYNYMDAGIASTILFVYPVLVALIMLICYHERISVIVWGGIALALAGIFLLSKGTNGVSLSFIGMVFVMLSSLSYALYIVGVNRSVLKDMPVVRLTFYALLFGFTIYLVRLHGVALLIPVHTTYGWINVICLAILPTILSLICTTFAIHHIGSTITAILGALEPVTALFIGVTLFHEPFTGRILLGVTLVLIAVSLIILEKPMMKKLKYSLRRTRID